jgi:multiple sugar transport system substrate-binding protein
MKHRKTAALVLLSLSAAGSLAACGTSAGSSSAGTNSSGPTSFAGQTLTVLEDAPSGAKAKATTEDYNWLAEQFKKQTGATIKFQYYSSGSQETTIIETSAVSGSGPDVIDYGSGYAPVLAATNGYLTFGQSDWTAVGGRGAFLPSQLLESGDSPTTDVGVPYESNPQVLAYNTSYFTKAGITSPPTTWTEFVQDAQKVQAANPGVAGVGIDPVDPYDPWKTVWLISRQSDSNFISPDLKTAQLASAPVKAATLFYLGMVYQYHISPQASLGWNNAQMVANFTSGKTAMELSGEWSTSLQAQGTPLAGHLGFAPLPNVPYGMTSRPAGAPAAEAPIVGSWYAIAKSAGTRIPLAEDFIKLSVGTAAQLEALQTIGNLPVTHAAIAAAEAKYPSSKPFFAAEQGGVAQPNTLAWSDIEAGIETILGNIAGNIASSGSYSPSYGDAQFATEQTAVQAHIQS